MTFRTLGYRNIDSRPNLWYKGIRSEEISHGLPVYLYPKSHNLLLLRQSGKSRRVPAPAALHCHVLIYVLEGTLSITANGHAREVAPGEYIFLRSEEEHFGHAASSGKLSYLWMHFDTHTPWSRISSDESIPLYDSCTYLFPEYGRGSTDFPLLFGDLMQWYRKGTAVAEKALPQTASLLLFHLTSAFLDRRESRPLTLTPVIVAVKEYIRTNCHTALTPYG